MALVRSYRASKNASFCTPGRQKIVSMPFTSSIDTTAWAVVRVVMAVYLMALSFLLSPSYGGGREGESLTGYALKYENYDLKWLGCHVGGLPPPSLPRMTGERAQ